MDNDNVHIDYKALLDYLKNDALNKFMISMVDEDSRDFIFRFLITANKHGIPTETIMKIFTDMLPRGEDGYILPDEDDENVAPY